MDMLDTHVSGSSAVSPALLVVHEDLIIVVEVVVKTLSREVERTVKVHLPVHFFGMFL
jgi:hypothetical protein